MSVKEYAVETMAMKPNAEIQKQMSRFYQAVSTGDFENLERIVSHQPGSMWIGTDPSEWWEGPEAVIKAWQTQTAEMGGPVPIAGGDARAYQHGDVAWVSDRPVFRLPDGRNVPFRFTAVWLQEPDGWRIVQAHASFGIANETMLRTP